MKNKVKTEELSRLKETIKTWELNAICFSGMASVPEKKC